MTAMGPIPDMDKRFVVHITHMKNDQEVQKALITSVHDLESRVSKLEKAVIALYEWLNHASADECKNACKEIYS